MPPQTSWLPRSSGCSAPNADRATGNVSGKPSRLGIARSLISARTFTTNKPAHLVARYDLLVVEDLQIANMLRRAKPVPDPDNPGQYLANGPGPSPGSREA